MKCYDPGSLRVLNLAIWNSLLEMGYRFSANPTDKHKTAVEHVFRYLSGTADWGLVFDSNNKSSGLCGYVAIQTLIGPETTTRGRLGVMFSYYVAPLSRGARRDKLL